MKKATTRGNTLHFILRKVRQNQIRFCRTAFIYCRIKKNRHVFYALHFFKSKVGKQQFSV